MSGERTRRRTVARHGDLHSTGPARNVLSLLGVVAVVVVVSIVSVAAFALWLSADTLRTNAVTLEGGRSVPPSIGAIEGGVNVLLAGTDSCEGQDVQLFPRCGIDDDGLERNDVTMLVNISDNPRRVTVVSFPRDMLVDIPSCPDGDGGRHPAMGGMPINASYGYGGLPCTVLAVEELTGIDVQFAGAVRWTGVIALSDAVGGVEVCLSGDVSDAHTGLELSAGTHTLQGTQALQFLRMRHGIGDGSDLGRISNQQQFMSSLVRRIQADGTLDNPAVLLNLANTALQQVNQGQLILDQNLANPTLMVQIAMALRDVPHQDIVFVQYPTVYSGASDLVLPVTEAADVLFAAVRANQPLELTGEASQGFGVEVTGEAPPASEPDRSTPTPTPAAPTPPAPTSSSEPAPIASPSETAVELPSDIAGTDASEITCTVPEGQGF